MDKIKKILSGYKGAEIKSVSCKDNVTGGMWLWVKAMMTPRQMKLAATKILKKYKDIDGVHFEGSWLNYIYTRETLKRAE